MMRQKQKKTPENLLDGDFDGNMCRCRPEAAVGSRAWWRGGDGVRGVTRPPEQGAEPPTDRWEMEMWRGGRG